MPTLTLADGTTFTWGDAPPAVPDYAPPPTDVATAAPPDVAPPTATSVTETDVQAALAKVPPKWASTALRAGKTFAAGMAAALGVAWVTTGGTWEGMLHDPGAFLTALGTAILMGAWKWFGWKEPA
jgi:hypothetical protein